jgi:hypothetical protein
LLLFCNISLIFNFNFYIFYLNRALESEKENFSREKINLLQYVEEIEKNIEKERQQEKAEMREKGKRLFNFSETF